MYIQNNTTSPILVLGNMTTTYLIDEVLRSESLRELREGLLVLQALSSGAFNF